MKSIITFFLQRNILQITLLTAFFILPISAFSLDSNTINDEDNNGGDCCEKRGGNIDKPTKLIFTYAGGGCSFNNINSSEGKHQCINGTSVSGPQLISILEDGELIGGARTIEEGEMIEIYVKKGGGNNFGNELQVKIGNQVIEIHTSCSDALVSGEHYGALRLEAVNGENGITCGNNLNIPNCTATFTNEGSEVGLLWQYFGNDQWSSDYVSIQPGATHTQTVADNEVWEVWNQADNKRFAEFIINCADNTNYTFTNGGGNGNDCCEKRGGSIDKPTKLTFEYTGGGCSFNNVNSSEGKHQCINSTPVSGPQLISILDEGELIGGARTIEEGEIVEIYVKKGGGNNFGNELQVKIGNQVVEIHTSCSDALVSGENYGALRLVAVNGENNITCGTPPPPCTLTGGTIGGDQSGCVTTGTFNPSMLTNIEAAIFTGSCNTNSPIVGNCCEEHGNHNHLQKISLRYVGSGSNMINAYADKRGSTLLYSGNTNPNDIILLDASNISGSKYDDRFDSGAKVEVGNTTLELHSSCSRPIDAGMGIDADGELITNPNPNDADILFIVEGLSTPDGCLEGTLDNTPPPTDEEAISYQWQYQLMNGSWTDIPEANTATYAPPAISQTTKYRRVAANCCGEAISNEVTISIVTEAPSITLSKSNDLNCTLTSTTLTVNSVESNILWNTGQTGNFLIVSNPGTYSVTVTSSGGCIATSSIAVNSNVEKPAIEACEYRIQEEVDWTTNNCTPTNCLNSRLELSVSPNNYSSYQWTGPNGFFGKGNNDGDVLVANALSSYQAGTYTVTVTDENGCTNTATIDVSINDCLCDLSAEITNKRYMDNNTTDRMYHTFSYDLRVNSANSGNWIMYDVINGHKNRIVRTGSYGQLLNLGPYPINTRGTIFIIMDANNSNCFQTIGVNMSDCVYTGACHCGNKKGD